MLVASPLTRLAHSVEQNAGNEAGRERTQHADISTNTAPAPLAAVDFFLGSGCAVSSPWARSRIVLLSGRVRYRFLTVCDSQFPALVVDTLPISAALRDLSCSVSDGSP